MEEILVIFLMCYGMVLNRLSKKYIYPYLEIEYHTRRSIKIDLNLRDNNDITINRINIHGMNLKEFLNEELIKKLDDKIGNYTLYSLNILLDGEMPSSLISVGHNLGGDYKGNILTIHAESEENLKKFLELL